MNNRIEIRPGRTINVTLYQHPSSTTTAFLFHGLGGRHDQWREQINMLRQHYTLVMPDLYGHGDSDKPKPNGTNPYAYPELDQDLHAVFTKYAGANNVVLGHSYGGALAVSLAIDHQDQVSHLVLLSPVACSPNIQIPAIYRLPTFLMEWLRPFLEKKFEQSAFDPSAPASLILTEREAGRLNPMYVICATIKGMEQTNRVDVTMLTIPTLVIMGNTDKLILPDISRQFYQRTPHHHFEMIEHAAHMAMLERPEVVNSLITHFLQK